MLVYLSCIACSYYDALVIHVSSELSRQKISLNLGTDSCSSVHEADREQPAASCGLQRALCRIGSCRTGRHDPPAPAQTAYFCVHSLLTRIASFSLSL